MNQIRLNWRLNPRELCLRDLNINIDTNDITSICSKYGRIIKFHRTQDKTKLFCTFLSESLAANAFFHLSTIGYKVSYASEKVPRVPSNPTAVILPTVQNHLKVCANCGKEAGLVCSRCGVPYCSKLCQTSHWPVHEKMCIYIPDLVPNARPIDNNLPKADESIKKDIAITTVGKKRASSGETSECSQSKFKIKKLENRPTISAEARVTKITEHYPEVKTKRGVCHFCNELTREHCSSCQFYLCIHEKNCFHNFHLGQSIHFAEHVQSKSTFLCKTCNERKAKYQCLQCVNQITQKKAYFCINSKKNCFEEFHKKNNL